MLILRRLENKSRTLSSIPGLQKRTPTLPCSIRHSSTRPAFAPKPILDIKHIRQNPGLYEQNCIDRNYGAHSKAPWRIIELHAQWLALQAEGREVRDSNRRIYAQLSVSADHVKKGETAGKVDVARGNLIQKAKALKPKIKEIEEQEESIMEEIQTLAMEQPNLSSTSTPVGEEAEVVGFINGELQSPTTAKSHVEIGQELGILDFSSSNQTSGWGWYFLVGDGAMLEQALVQYALQVARSRGWKAVAPPSLVYSHIAVACGFQPRDQNGEQQVYAIEQSEKDKAKPQLSLAGTAEIPLAGMKANQTLKEEELPLKVVGVSRCYRAEAGARGADTKGLYRVHEFTKVEMFAWTRPDSTEEEHFEEATSSSSEALFEEMLSIQEEILTNLGLRCRILEMPTTDLGASATRKRDMEAFFPSRIEKDEGWGEVTSASMCTDYQSRRLLTRMRVKDGKQLFPYTLNGTALAVPRVLAAILEKHWNEAERTVTVPEVLRVYLGGQDKMQAPAGTAAVE